MRKIESQMLQAIATGKNWQNGNTSTRMIDDCTLAVFLHGNEIAVVNTNNGNTYPTIHTFRDYPTATTRSRLRALGISASIRQGRAFIDGQMA